MSPVLFRPSRPLVSLLAIVLAASACGGDSSAPSVSASPVPTSISVTPQSLTLGVGDHAAVVAEVRDEKGNMMEHPQVVWSSSQPAVVSVATDGTLKAVALGTASVKATIAGKSAAANITVDAVYDVAARGVPHIVTRSYLDLSKIERISRFRSGFGHDYSDHVETCRSMKHYMMPYNALDWRTIDIVAPFDGVVTALLPEQTFGTQVQLQSSELPAATAVIFHVQPDAALSVGTRVSAGAHLGTHIGNATLSDVALWISTPTGRRLVSYVEAMTDDVFAELVRRGVAARSALVISAAERDASPLVCNGEAFADGGTIENWVGLR